MEKEKEPQNEKNAKVIKLKITKSENPLKDVMQELEKINQALNKHWKNAKSKNPEEDEDQDQNDKPITFS